MLHFFRKCSLNATFFKKHRLDIILSSLCLLGVGIYIVEFTTTYPDHMPNFQLYSQYNSKKTMGDLHKKLEQETLVHISYTSTTGLRNKQQIQRFVFTNKDIAIIDIFPVSEKEVPISSSSIMKNFKTFYSFETPHVLVQKLPVLFYVNSAGKILDFH